MSRIITNDELREHNSAADCWIVIDGKVYDVTPFLDEHPGGRDVIVDSGGKDATEEFDIIGHTMSARELLQRYFIGDAEPGLGKKQAPAKSGKEGGSIGVILVAVLLVVLAYGAYALL